MSISAPDGGSIRDKGTLEEFNIDGDAERERVRNEVALGSNGATRSALDARLMSPSLGFKWTSLAFK